MARDLLVDYVSRVHLVALALAVEIVPLTCSAQGTKGEPVQTLTIQRGDVSVLPNALSPGLLSGVDSLFNQADAPDFNAFDPADRGASAGLNFEHVICGHSNTFNAFSPRRGRYELFKLPDDRSAMLVRKSEDDPWALSSTLKYSVNEPSAIDFEFECRAHNKELFGKAWLRSAIFRRLHELCGRGGPSFSRCARSECSGAMGQR